MVLKPLLQALARLSGRESQSLASHSALVPSREGMAGSGGHQAWCIVLLGSKQQLLPEFRNSLVGSKAPDEGAEQGPDPGG